MNTSTYSTADEGTPLRERLARVLYTVTLLLAFTTLWAMAETRSLESQMGRYLPPIDITQLNHNQL
jgi:hypothetical protein